MNRMNERNDTWTGRFEKHDCPNCGHDCYRDEANVGVGTIYGPWGCPCGWSEDERYNTLEGPKFTENGYKLDQYGGATPPGGYGTTPGPVKE
jgi:hypothetical protein